MGSNPTPRILHFLQTFHIKDIALEIPRKILFVMPENNPENKSEVIKKIIPKPAGKEKGTEKIEKGKTNDE